MEQRNVANVRVSNNDDVLPLCENLKIAFKYIYEEERKIPSLAPQLETPYSMGKTLAAIKRFKEECSVPIGIESDVIPSCYKRHTYDSIVLEDTVGRILK